MKVRAAAMCLVAAVALAVLAASAGAATPRDVIRVGGPSAPSESKVAIVGSRSKLAGKTFTVVDGAGQVVLSGKLTRAKGKPAPWPHAYAADLSAVTTPGTYRVRVGKLTSRPWQVSEAGGRPALAAILAYFAANRDGNEPSPIHGPAHLHDAVIHPNAPVHAGTPIEITGGWMDAGDMIHFTQTTAFATALLEAAARLDPADAAQIGAEANVGVRWLLKAHPFADAFVAQVGDGRDHKLGFRNPAADDASSRAGIGTRNAYVLPPNQIGGDIGGKAATALAMAHQRTGVQALLDAAREWYAAGKLSGAAAPDLQKAGYPKYAGGFYVADHWQDSMASAAVELFRSTGDPAFLADFGVFAGSSDSRADGTIGAVDGFAALGAADGCGALGLPPLSDPFALARACGLLAENAQIAVSRAAKNAFGMPGFFSWGTTAQNGAAGALAAFGAAAGVTPSGCAVAAGARDYLLGRNPFGASFIVGHGPKSPRHPHHWGSVFGKGIPAGAVVGGPAPRKEIEGQDFSAGGPLQSRFATYEDEKRNYVTSEPAIDYSAASILMLAAVEAHC